MAVLNGTVDIRISTKSEGNAAAGVRAVAKEVDALDKTSVAARNPIAALGSGLMALKDGVSPVENIKSAVDSLTGTFAFAGGAIGIVGSIVGTLVGVLATAESATAKLIRTTEEAATKSHDHTQALIEQGKAAVGAAENMRELQASVFSAMAANAASQGDTDTAFSAQLAAGIELAGKAVEDVTAKIDKLSTEQNNLGFSSRALGDEIGKQQEAFNSLVKTYGKFTADGGVVINVHDELTEAIARVVEKRHADIKALKEQRAMQELRIGSIDGEIKALKALREEKAVAASEAGVIMMDEMTFTPRKPAGRRPAKAKRDTLGEALDESEAANALDFRAWEEEQKRIGTLFAMRTKRESEQREFEALVERGLASEPGRRAAEQGAAMASTIRDFSASLGEGIPMMTEFAGALSNIATSWDQVAAANDNVMQVEEAWREGKASERDLVDATAKARKLEGKAALDSVGAIAKAGAEQIKNERLRAGVLAIIETGLSIASFAMQDYVGGAAHAAAAVILGSVAIFGGSKASGSNTTQARTQQLSTGTSQAQTVVNQVNINGGWYGGSSAQENAWALQQQQRRHLGNGFARAA